MEMKENSKHKTWKMSSTNDPSLTSDSEASSLKRFTIPKIGKTTEEVFLSACSTSTREHSFIHSTLRQCRLDVSRDLQLTWQFGETKLIRNKDLERKFSAKRSEMRESGRHGRELEEHFCFLVPPQSDVVEIYEHGISAKASTLKILGNPLLGIYIFRHVDVALNYAHSRSIAGQSIVIFKVLFGKVKKIQPCVDKNKVSLDPSPNFDCHMSRYAPSLKDAIELQAYNSAVYAYEYDVFSKPVDKPRQCLPYAIVTVKFIGQKAGNGHLMTSLRFPSTGFPKRFERTCALSNCTVAKRIGKGKDATVIFEHFRKPLNPYVQENCSCKALDSERNPYNSNMSNSNGNVKNGNLPLLETYNGQRDNHSAEIRDASQVHENNSDHSFMPHDNREIDLFLNFSYLKSILSNISAAYPSHNNPGTSTVITSKLIKDPRLIRREQNMGKQNNNTVLSDISPLDNSVDNVNSGINLSSLPANSSTSSEVVPGDHAVLTDHFGASCFQFSFEDSQCQTHNMGLKDYDCVVSNEITMTGQCKEQCNFALPISLSNVVSEVENQKHIEEKAQSFQERSNFPFLTKQSREPPNSKESVDTCRKESKSHISQKSQCSNLKAVNKVGHQMSTMSPLQKKGNIDECIENTGTLRTLIDTEDNSKCGANQNWWKESNDYFNIETKIVNNCNALHQEYKEGRNLNYLGGNCEKRRMPQELQVVKSNILPAKDKDELDHVVTESRCNLTPNVECFSQKDPQCSLDYEDTIHTSFATNQKLMELKNQNCVNIVCDAVQEAEGIPQAKDVLIDKSLSEDEIILSLDNSNCNITREYVCVQRKNKNEPFSLESIQKDYKETPLPGDEDPDPSLFCSSKLNINNFKGQREDKENPNEANEEDSISSPECKIETVDRCEKHDFHMDNMVTNIVETGDNRNYNTIEILSSEGSSKFNLFGGEKDIPTDSVTAIKQRSAQNDGSVEHLASMVPKIAGVSVGGASNSTEQVASTTKPTLSTNREIDQRCFLKNTSSESSPFSLLKHRVSDYEINMDKNKLQYSFHPSVNENSSLENFELASEAEIQCGDALLWPQDTCSHGNVLDEEFELYEVLKSRIDWEGLFGVSNEEREPLGSSPQGQNSEQHNTTEDKCVHSFAQKNKREFLNSILLPDLQVTVINGPVSGFSLIDDSFALKDFYKSITESSKPEINEGKSPGVGFFSQPSSENSSFSCEDKLDNSVQEQGLVSKSEIFHSSDFSHTIHENNTSEKPSCESLTANLSTVTVTNESKCSSTKSKTGFNDARNEKDMESKMDKRKLLICPKDQTMSHKDIKQHDNLERRKKVTSQDSCEWFSSLSQGRMKTFSQSERHIRSVLNILNSEASLCKSKRLSKKLDRAVLHLKKAHRRVNTSLQIISNVGKRKGPLPKAYAITCNNFWESCDLQGSVSERKYSKNVLSKKKYSGQEEKRPLRFDIDEALAQVSKHKSYRTNTERLTECLPSEIMSGSVSQSLTTSHVRHCCDEQHPESQLPLIYICQKGRQSEECNSIARNASSPAPEHSSETGECMLYPDETLTEKECHTDTELANSDYAELENHSTYNSKDVTKENNSEPNAVINESNLASLSCIKDNSRNTDNCDASCEAHSDMLGSDLDFNAKHFLNADVYKQDNLKISVCKGNQGVIFPLKECAVAISTLSIPKGNILRDPLSITASKLYSIPALSSTLAIGDEEESLESSMGQHRTSAASTAVLSCHQLRGGRERLKTKLSSSSAFLVSGNEIRLGKHSESDLASVIEESKSCKKNITEKLFSNNCSLFFKDNVKYSSKRSTTTKDIHKGKIKKTEQAVYPKSTSAGPIVNIEYKSQEEEILKEFFNLTKKTNKSNMIDTYLSIKNATLETITLKNMLSSHLSKRKKMENKVSSNSLCDYISKPAIIRIGHDHPETTNTTALREKPTSYISELQEKHCLANCVSSIAELSRILQRADEASSLQILEEETKICQNMLPLFVEAFERKQECSLEQILISRELLVEENLWNNCHRKLKPCAIDTLVELQIVMETIQFIENKKRYLKGELTFRSLLWYDETLYSELLGRPRGYQMQPNFYPAFQGRLKYNALCELQNYHSQLVKCFAETKKENSYYALLKYKRQINECKAIMKHSSDCFDFCLSVPFTCGVNFGDTLEDLETIRKSILKLITTYGDSPKIQSLPGKKDHLWIIIELISSKVNFIKSNEEVSVKISLYGLEHICFDAAKHLVWKEKSYSFLKNTQKKNQEMLVTVNKCAFSRLQKIYDTLINVPTPNIELEEDASIASRQSDDPLSIGNYGFPRTLLSHPDICCVSEILDQAEFADIQKLQELTLRCTEHLEVLKKCFQKLQEDDIDDIFVTEENVLDVLSNQQHGAVILKPAAVETYIDVVMLSETVHFLKNSMAKKLDTQTFRGLLWFDLSLLPELTHCQEQMAAFSLNDNPACLWKVIESTVSDLKKELDAIYECNEAVNCSYALHLFSRELEELSEIKNLVKNSEYSISTYIDFVPYIASINYGNTVTELEHNYNQFAMLLKNMLSFPQKDLGKMAHIMKVMKTIKHMKIITAKSANLSTYFILYQMLHNRNTSQLEKKGKMNIHVTKPEENSNQPSTSTQVPSISECINKTTSNSSKKRPLTVDKSEEDSWENENTATISSCKKQKVTMKDVADIDGEKTVFEFPRTMESHPRDEIKIASSSSDNVERNCLSPKIIERQSSFPGSALSLKNLQDTCTLKSDSKIDLANSSPNTTGSCTQQPEKLNSIKKTNMSFSAAEINESEDCPETYYQKCRDGTFLEDCKTPSQELHESPPEPSQKTCLSNIKTRIDQCLVPDAAGLSVPTFHSVGAVCPSLEVNTTDLEHQDNAIDLSIKDDTDANSPEPLCVQDKIPVLQVNKTQFTKTETQGKYEEESLNPRMAPFSSESSTLDVNQTAQYFLSEQGEENPKVLPHRPDTCWREPPQAAYVPVSHSEQQFGASYPYSAWCVYQYNSSSGSTVTHTYQGITSYEGQSPPGTVTAVASTVQSTHSHLLYSEYFSYSPEQPQVNAFIPGNGYFSPQMPVPYNFQQPIFSQFAFHQPLPQTAYPYPPNPGVLPQVPWIYAPWQQQPFPPRH